MPEPGACRGDAPLREAFVCLLPTSGTSRPLVGVMIVGALWNASPDTEHRSAHATDSSWRAERPLAGVPVTLVGHGSLAEPWAAHGSAGRGVVTGGGSGGGRGGAVGGVGGGDQRMSAVPPLDVNAAVGSPPVHPRHRIACSIPRKESAVPCS